MEPNQDPNANPNPAPMGGVDAVTAAMNGGVATSATPETPITPTMSAMPEMATAPAGAPEAPVAAPEAPVAPTLPEQPATPEVSAVPEAAPSSAAEQLEAALNEMPAPAPVAPVQPMEQPAQGMPLNQPKKKSNLVMILCAVLLVIVAVGGIAFGVIEMLNGQNAAKDYEKQIADLRSTNSSLRAQLNEVESLNGDEALELLQAAAVAQSAPYQIGYANVYAKYVGDEDMVAYWVKYMPINVPEGTTIANDIIFMQDDDGDWEFTLPGFTAATEEMVADYEVLNQ